MINNDRTYWSIKVSGRPHGRFSSTLISGRNGPIKFLTEKDAKDMIEILRRLDKENPQLEFVVVPLVRAAETASIDQATLRRGPSKNA
jgi:hypothetical protein